MKDKVDFLPAYKHQRFHVIGTSILGVCGQVCPNSPKQQVCYFLQYLRREVNDEVVSLHADKHESFLQVDFSTLGIRVSNKVILSLLIGMMKHSESTQSKKFAISLQYLKHEVRDGSHFLHADKHQSFYKLALLFLMEMARHVQRIQNMKLVIF